MAEGCSGPSNWWSGWIQSAKEKSAEALEFVKKDLNEFTNTVQNDSKQAIVNVKDNINQDNVSAATRKARDGVTTFLGEISKALVVEAEDKHSKPRSRGAAAQPIFDRAKARLNAIQVDEGTYVNEPSGSAEEYAAWQESFHLDSHKGKISELLVVNVEVRSLYTQLVPSMVSHANFWQRYFYKLHQLQEDEARRAALKKRAEDSSATLAWSDSEDDTDDWVDMSGPSSPPSDSHMMLHRPGKDLPDPSQRIPDPSSLPLQGSEDDNLKKFDSKQGVFDIVQDSVMDRGSDSVTENVQNEQTEERLKNVQQDESSETKQDLSSQQRDTDFSSTDKNNTNMDSSVDTLTTITPIDQSTTSVSQVSDSRKSSSDSSLEILKVEESMGTSAEVVTIVEPTVCEPQQVVASKESTPEKIKTHEKGDLVVVGSSTSSERTTPSSSSENKDLEDDWEREFDVEVTEEDLKLAQKALTSTTISADDQDDEWESWD